MTKTLGKHGDSVTGIAFSPDGKFILTTSSEPANKPDKGAAVWSVVGLGCTSLIQATHSVKAAWFQPMSL